MCPVNSQNDEKLAYYAFSLTNACAVARRTRRKIYYSLRLLLIPTFLLIEIISYCLEYICPLVDFNMNY